MIGCGSGGSVLGNGYLDSSAHFVDLVMEFGGNTDTPDRLPFANMLCNFAFKLDLMGGFGLWVLGNLSPNSSPSPNLSSNLNTPRLCF